MAPLVRVPQPDPVLVELAADCSPSAVDALVEKHQPVLRLAARRYTETPEDREDLIQEVVLRLLDRGKKALREWRPIAPFAAYLTTIATRHGIRRSRQRSRLAAHEVKALPGERAGDYREPDLIVDRAPAPAEEQPEAQVAASERDDAVAQAMTQLSEADQAILRLRFYEDLNAAQIARMLNIGHAATRKRVSRALRRLERALDGVTPEVFI